LVLKLNIIHIDKPEDKEEISTSSEPSKSPPHMDISNGEKSIIKPTAAGCNELIYNYQSPTDNGEMKRFLFNDFVAQAAVANAGIVFQYLFF
jgi:hypothetical protein